MNKFKLTIEYDGTNYQGWQTQQNASSIQDTIILAAGKILQGKVELQGSGRTDAGVHALGQVAHLVTDSKISPQRLVASLNELLPAAINIIAAEPAPTAFHARHDAVMRSYIYLVSKRRTAFGKRYVWWVKDRLNLENMKAAISPFRGFHDFASFADKRLDRGTSTKVQLDFMELHPRGDLLIFRIGGSHFLWKMVRRMVGIIVEAGRGNLGAPEVEKMLTERSDLPARHTAPPSGLFLEQVLYPGDKLRPLGIPETLAWHLADRSKRGARRSDEG